MAAVESRSSVGPYGVFVDESEVGGYSMTAVYLGVRDFAATRERMRAHLRKRQRAIHFTQERDEVRKAVVATMRALPVAVKIYHCDDVPKAARPRCLEALAKDVARDECLRLVLDQNDSWVVRDRQVLSRVLRGWNGTYDHLRDHEEPLLWVADAVSWCWNRKGLWRAMLSGLSVQVVEVAAG